MGTREALSPPAMRCETHVQPHPPGKLTRDPAPKAFPGLVTGTSARHVPSSRPPEGKQGVSVNHIVQAEEAPGDTPPGSGTTLPNPGPHLQPRTDLARGTPEENSPRPAMLNIFLRGEISLYAKYRQFIPFTLQKLCKLINRCRQNVLCSL